MATNTKAPMFPTNSAATDLGLGLGTDLQGQTREEIEARRKKLLAMGQPGAQAKYGMDPMGGAAAALGLGGSR